MDLLEIVRKCGIVAEDMKISSFLREEDASEYQVWLVSAGEQKYVLKKAKGQELAVYAEFFAEKVPGAPRLLGSCADYFLMEYVPGENLCRSDRERLRLALDALIALQDRFWDHDETGYAFADSLAHRKKRGEYLRDAQLERAYEKFLTLYEHLPRTLCHDDLLPFNVLVSDEKATIIDWECAGILPYPVSLARLIAHGTEDADAFFYMTEEDRAFAIDYYYENLIQGKGIAYSDYRRALDYFLLYEYCEWIMLGNKYPDADMVRYHFYLNKARAHVDQKSLA